MKQTVTLPAYLFPATDTPLVAVVERWEKTLGQAVMAGETLLVLRAGNAVFAVESPAWGVITRKCVLPGESVEAGEPVAVLGGVSAPLSDTIAEPFASPPAYIPGGEETVYRLSPAESAVFAHHERSLSRTAHGVAVTIADVSDALRYIERTGRGETVSGTPETLTLLPFVLCAVAASLLRHPEINAQRTGEGDIRRKHYANIGVESFGETGILTVPVLKNVHQKSVLAINREWAHLQNKVAESRLEPANVSGATFTVSVAPQVLYRTPVLHTPLAGHLCFGKTVKDSIYLCLAYDATTVPANAAEAFLQGVAESLGASGFLFA